MTAPAFPPTDAPLSAPVARGYPSHLDPHPEPTLFLLSLPWLISAAFHLGIALLAAFIAFATYQALNPANPDQIIIPSTFEDPSYSDHPGGIPNPGLGDPSKESAAQRLKDLAKAEGWANSSSQNPADMLGGQSGEAEVAGIFRGMGGNMGNAGTNATGEAKAGAYGSGGGQGIGPKSSFYGTGGNASRIVYIIDTSGSLVGEFQFIQSEVKRSISNLVPLQFVGLVCFADTATLVTGPTLIRATPDAKKELRAKIDNLRAEGPNNEELAPFQSAFEKAFSLKPQLIYFLTDGQFDPRLPDVVTKLNPGKKIKINTVAFVSESPIYKTQLKALAEDNGGVYRFIPMKDLGK